MTFYDIKTSILPILKRQGVLKAALFGSFARNEGGKNSDIDILVKLDKNKTLLDLIALRLELKKKLHMNVDVLTYDSINHLLKSRIMKEQRVIYEQRP
ncbi:MAG: nucleotidyltransferase family protein [Gallionella sp.]|nr:nucleotidyltransferase family protein [Gallionella sp.]